ncbi:MAG: NAD(P)H-hydrate dehydratase, partial [Chloroflexi bacterium]|nr:NAD(P)H-hydrate dehydratase [Chloroflexota bacterium]
AKDVSLEVASADWVRAMLPARPRDANKGTFGKVLVVAGSGEYIGAAYLACAGAVRAGAGLVTLATPRSLVPVVASRIAEVTYLPLPESAPGEVNGAEGARLAHQALPNYDALLIGCGVGQKPGAVELVRQTLTAMPTGVAPRTVIDADGLNILSQLAKWWERVPRNAVLTPHPGEMSRLSGQAIAKVQGDRLQASREAAKTWSKTVLLKGAYSVVARPEGQAMINPFANAALATAGTGDVLAGIIAGMLAQGLAPFEAAAVAAYIHGAAGERVADQLGDTGTAASDLLTEVPRAVKGLRGG